MKRVYLALLAALLTRYDTVPPQTGGAPPPHAPR